MATDHCGQSVDGSTEHMKRIQVKLTQNPYDILIGYDCFNEIGRRIKSLKIGTDAVIITSPVIKKLHGAKLRTSLKASGITVKEMVVPDGEQSKSATVAIDLIEKIAQYDVYKKVFVIAFGGGVIGDLAGYVAAAYKRGIPYVQVPTTFLAQIDSSIGGKVAVDLTVGKNLMGAFHQPKMVFSDTAVLKTLSRRQIQNGFAEAIKYGIIEDAELFTYIETNYNRIFEGEKTALMHVVKRCSEIKTRVVLADERETLGIRTILNYGHTVGHAIEAAGNFTQYDHGQAIAVGMRIAGEISYKYGMVTEAKLRRMNRLISDVGLPEKFENLEIATILKLMRHDKKFISGKNRFVLCRGIGRVTVVEGVDMKIIRAAIKKYMA